MPSSVIQNLTVEPVLDSLVVTWETPNIASTTQVWYNLFHPTSPTSPTSSTLMLGGTLYLPFIARNAYGYPYAQVTPLDMTRTTQHRAIIRGLEDGDVIQLIATSAFRVDDANVKTVVVAASGELQHTMSVPPLTRVYLPAIIKALE
jgi:hypothetical protein